MLLYSVPPLLHASPHRWKFVLLADWTPKGLAACAPDDLVCIINFYCILFVMLFPATTRSSVADTVVSRRVIARQVKFHQRRLVSPLQFVVSIMQPAKSFNFTSVF